MREKGIRFVPIYGRQAFKIEGRFKFWGGLTIESASIAMSRMTPLMKF